MKLKPLFSDWLGFKITQGVPMISYGPLLTFEVRGSECASECVPVATRVLLSVRLYCKWSEGQTTVFFLIEKPPLVRLGTSADPFTVDCTACSVEVQNRRSTGTNRKCQTVLQMISVLTDDWLKGWFFKLSLAGLQQIAQPAVHKYRIDELQV